MEDDQVHSPEQDSPSNYIDIKELMPANPIYDKPATEQPKPVLRIQIVKNQIIAREPQRPVFKKQSESEKEEEDSVEEPESPFQIYYQDAKCLYRKFNNDEVNSVMHTVYFASCFVDKRLFRQNKEPLGTLQQLQKEVLGEITEAIGATGKNDIRFDSNFQSGNLFAVYKKNPTQYDLILQNDINSKGNTQWFYFTVTNLPQNVQITFNIVNLLKSDSLFNYGMQPVVFSQTKNKKSAEGWSRQGRCISYTKNTIRREKSKRFYYTLSFKLTSKIANDTLHVAHCFPYTYTQLRNYMFDLVKSSPKKGTIISRTTIGKTLGNNPIQVLTITDTPDKKPDTRKIIVIMARQHPGQTQGSYVCQGVMSYLTSKKAEWLRKNFVFKVIPMVNPDGVIFGNYRSNLMGFDLNRKWDVYDKDGCFPEVRCIKEYISELSKEKRVRVILDLHGHSKKLNSFFYGNPCPQHPEQVRGFPFACSRLNPQITFEDCTFTIEQEKRKAARVYLSLTHHLTNVYTFESSFYGYTKDNKKYAFGIQEFKGLGASLMQGLHSFMEYDQLIEQKAIDKLPLTQYFKYIVQLQTNPNLIPMGDRKQSGSQSNPQEYQMKNNVNDGVVAETMTQDVNGHEQQENDEGKKQGNSGAVQQRGLGSRKGKRQSKQVTKNPRQLKVMQISRVNSILPDKYQLALQPTPTPPPTIPQTLDRKRSTLRHSLRDFKTSTHTQTAPLQQCKWQQLKVIDIDEIDDKMTPVKNTVEARPPSSKFKDGYDVKYTSLTSTKGRKNNTIKLDVLSTRPLEPVRSSDVTSLYGSSSCLIKTKNRFSQTFLTYTGLSQNSKFRSITHFPSVDSAVQRAAARQQTKIRGVQIFKANRLNSKRDNQDFLNQMVRKYLVNMKDRKVKPIISQQQRIFYEKSSPVRAQDLNERPLSIKKKEIFVTKKLNCKSRS